MTTWAEIRKPDTLDTLRYMVRLALEDHSGHTVSTAVRCELAAQTAQRKKQRKVAA